MNLTVKYQRQEAAFFIASIILAIVFPFSLALISIASGLLLAQALIFQSWQHPSVNLKSWRILLFPFSVFFLYLLATTVTKDISQAFYELKKMIFWLIIPLAVFISPRLPEKKIYIILLSFIISVFTSSMIITGKLLVFDSLQFSEFRALSIISHIRFSYQVVFTIIILCWFLIRKKYLNFKFKQGWIVALIVWFVLFLMVLKSLLGIISFVVTTLIALGFYARKISNLKVKRALFVVLFICSVLPFIYVGKIINDFYDFENINREEVDYKTSSGNSYHHDFEEKTRENGNLVFMYICETELRQEWDKRSDIKYDDIVNGYPVNDVLIRYLTSLGYRKDSAGISKLSDHDIQLINNGITNYKFRNHFFSIYPRIYETIWELDYYNRTGDPSNKTLAQRIEFIKASLLLIKEKPLFGIGTGNLNLKYNEVYEKMNTQLPSDKWSPSHNQYLNYMVKFGLIGFLIIMLAIIMPPIILKHHHNFIFIFFLIFYAIANLGDANLETHTGLSFFIFFYSMLLWNSTSLMKKCIAE